MRIKFFLLLLLAVPFLGIAEENITTGNQGFLYNKSDANYYGRGIQMPSMYGNTGSQLRNSKNASMHNSFSGEPLIPLEKPINPDEYVVGPGDIFSLNISGKTIEPFLLTIQSDGTIILPNGKAPNTKDKTISQLEKDIKDLMNTFYVGVEYKLVLSTPRKFLVHIVGEIEEGGMYSALAVERLSEIIQKTGGIKKHGSKNNIEIIRGSEITKVNLEKYYSNGDLGQNPYVKAGDVIKIPLKGKSIKIAGEVKKPGEYEINDQETLQDIISRTGGLTNFVSYKEPVKILRVDEITQDRKTVDIDLKVALAPETDPPIPLTDGDIITIPSLESLQQVVTVKGALVGNVSNNNNASSNILGGAPGSEITAVYQIGKGETVLDIINKAGGVTPYADLNNSYILRRNSKTEKPETVSLNLHKLIIEKDLSANIEILPQDQLIIPSEPFVVHVTGEVKVPAAIPYRTQVTFAQYISASGGPTTRAKLSRTTLIKKDGRQIKMSKNPVIEPGDTIFVPEIYVKFWQDHVQILLSVSSLTLSAFAIFK
jgi:protein involved in polysaccharide export with SLBB domain